jgi:Ran GTPase-activating protein (RanGAP) involved in mRNA processing and transport
MGLSGGAGPAFANLQLTGLRSLFLNLLYANDGTLADVLQSPDLPGVRTLHIFCGKVAMTAFAGVADGAAFRDLAALDLSQSYVEDEGASILATVDFPALRSLRLSSCRIRDEGVRALARAPWLTGLEWLHLNGNDLSSGTTELLAAPLASLRWLELGGAQVTPAGLAVLTASPYLQKLEILSLDGNFLGNAMGTLFAASDALPALRVLDLNDPNFTGEGLRALARWPGLARLEALNFSPVTADEDGLATLRSSPHYNPRMRIAIAGLLWNPTEE